jgi:hypothetical protein
MESGLTALLRRLASAQMERSDSTHYYTHLKKFSLKILLFSSLSDNLKAVFAIA